MESNQTRSKKNKHDYDYDLVVIGAGSGGVRASRISATHGAKVALIEEYRVGGTCVLRGCVPKKILWYSGAFGRTLHEMENYGWTIPQDLPKVYWPRLISNKDKELDRLNSAYISNLNKAGVEIINGSAKFIDPHTLSILGKDGKEEKKISADKILISSGSWPFMPKVKGIEHAMTSNEILEMKDLPMNEGLGIVGGGYIACEFAHIMNGAGVKVTQIYRGEQILRGFDDDLRSTINESSKLAGIQLLTNANVTEIVKLDNGKLKLVVTEQSSEKEKGTTTRDIVVEKLLYATGRKPNVSSINLEAAGVILEELKAEGGGDTGGGGGGIQIDEWSKTNVDHIYAVGDVTNRIMLTPVAINEGHAFADTVFGGNKRKMDYNYIASAVFVNPPAASCGVTEEEAVKKYGATGFDVYITKFTPMFHSISKSGVKSMMKLIVEKSSDKVVGCHMVDEHAPETMQMVSVAMKCGATKAQFDSTVGIHPTAAEELVTLRTKRV